MRSTAGMCFFAALSVCHAQDDGLNLLQVGVKKHNQTHLDAKLGGRGDGVCKMGGDTHVSSWYASVGRASNLDPMQYGLYNYANSKDGRFKSQLYQCPVPYQQYGWINAMAFEVDGAKIVVLPPKFGEISNNMPIYIRANDVEMTSAELPYTIPGTSVEIQAHKLAAYPGLRIAIEGYDAKILMPTYGGAGVPANSYAYVDVTVHLQPDNVPDLDENSFCVKGQEATPIVDSSDADWSASLFSDSDHHRICEFCESFNPFKNNKFPYSCSRPPPPPPPAPPAKVECEKNECSWTHGQQLCHSLQGDEALYNDCLFDFCLGCDDEKADVFVEEEEDEHPEPICVSGAPKCEPEEVCENSVKMNTLTVTQSNLGGVGPDSGAEELRYGNAAVVNGKSVDLVVTTDGKFKTNNAAKNGVTGEFGVLNVKCGTSVSLNMKVVDSESGAPVTLDAVSLTWYDLDEGKRKNGRATVTTCGSTGAMVSTNTELTVVREGDCSKATSSVAGTGKDNPKNPHDLTAAQLARAITLPFEEVSEWSSTLSLRKGPGGRNFLFAIEPRVACTNSKPEVKPSTWWCVARKNRGQVQGPYKNFNDAKNVLNQQSGNKGNQQMICEMSNGGAKRDPHKVNGQNQGAGPRAGFNKWWGNWPDINQMNNMCNDNSNCRSFNLR